MNVFCHVKCTLYMDIECIAITYFPRQPNDTTAINIHDNEHDSVMFIYHERCIFERFFFSRVHVAQSKLIAVVVIIFSISMEQRVAGIRQLI